MNKFWSPHSIILLIVIAFGGNLLLSYFFGEFFESRPFLAYGVQILVFIFAIFLCIAWNKQKVSLENIGFHKVPFFKTLGIIVLSWIIISALLVILTSLLPNLPGFQPQESHLDIFGNSLVQKIGFAILAIVIAPLFEEIIFRGILFPWMLQWLSPLLAIIFNGMLFGLLHLEFQSFIPLALIGTILAFLRYKTKSLYPTIGFHVINNTLAVFVEIFILQQ